MPLHALGSKRYMNWIVDDRWIVDSLWVVNLQATHPHFIHNVRAATEYWRLDSAISYN